MSDAVKHIKLRKSQNQHLAYAIFAFVNYDSYVKKSTAVKLDSHKKHRHIVKSSGSDKLSSRAARRQFGSQGCCRERVSGADRISSNALTAWHRLLEARAAFLPSFTLSNISDGLAISIPRAREKE
jgi:hypothetical protein